MIIKWLEVARQWDQIATSDQHVHGNREMLLRKFASELNIGASSVRRCSSALRFAEELVTAGEINDVDALSETSLEKLTILHRVARLSMDDAIGMLRGPDNIRNLRAKETALRTKLAENAAESSSSAIVRRLGVPLFRDAAVDAYVAAEQMKGREALRLQGRGVFLDASHVITRAEPGGPFHAARMVPTPGLKAPPGRHSGIAILAAALARIVERFDIVAEDVDDGERIAATIRMIGPCGAGVLHLLPDGSLEELHASSRLKAPDLLPAHVKAIDARFPSSRRRREPKVK